MGADILVNLAEDKDVEEVWDQVMAIVRASFRPEFLNRLDEIILFHRLKREQMAAIVDIQITRLQIVEGNKTHPIALICATGNRTAQLQRFLIDQGFEAVSDVSEGMHGNRTNGPGWILRGLPTVPYTG